MRISKTVAAFVGAATLSACVELEPSVAPEPATRSDYTEISASGLSAVRPYPNEGDVCVLLRDTKALEPFQADGKALIGCPKHETGAISDRRVQGARVVANAKHWVILSVDAPR